MALPDVEWNTTTIKSDKEGIRLTDANFTSGELNMQPKSAVKGRDQADRTEKKLEGEKKRKGRNRKLTHQHMTFKLYYIAAWHRHEEHIQIQALNEAFGLTVIL